MRICLVDNRSAGILPDRAATYIAELGPGLAEEHQVEIVTIEPGIAHLPETAARIRRVVTSGHPEIVHLNNLTGVTLAASLLAVGTDAAPFQPLIALGLHDDRLLKSAAGFHRRLTGSAGLVIAPASRLLDEHLARGFFATAIHQVIPYGMPYHGIHLVEAYRKLLIARRAGHLGDRAA